MYSNKSAKGLPIPSDAQAKEKLAIYVYEYLMHLGAKNSAQTFLSEFGWDKKAVNVGEAPGFLVSWWCVFWDLYCAAPERRDSFEPTQEAKMFHDFTNPNMMTVPQENVMSSNMISHNAFVNSPNQQQVQPNNNNNNQVMMPGGQQQQQQQPPYQRFHSAPRGIRVPSNVEYNQQPPAVNNTNPMNIDQSRVAAGISPMSRLTPPGNRIPPTNPQQQQAGMNQMNFNGPPSVGQSGIRPGNQPNPNQQQQQMTTNAPMSPMPMNMQQQQQQQQQQARWSNQSGPPNQQQQQPVPPPPPPPPQNSNMGYSSSSPVPYGSVGMQQQQQQQQQHHGGGPGTPGIIQSPQDGDINFNNMMKNGIQTGIQFHDPNLGHMVPINPEISHHSHLNSNLNGEILDAIKHSPMSNLSQRHHDEQSNAGTIPDLTTYTNFGDQLY